MGPLLSSTGAAGAQGQVLGQILVESEMAPSTWGELQQGRGREGPWTCGFLGAQVHRHFRFDDSLTWVGLGLCSAKVDFLPEECTCSGPTGLRMTGKESMT